MPRAEYSYDNAVNKIIELNEIYNPSFIYCDRGSGATIQLLKIYIYRDKYIFTKKLPTFIKSVERREIAQNSFNCWKFLKLVKLQRRIEKYSSVNVAKAEKINQMV